MTNAVPDTQLKDIIVKTIQQHGAMTIADYIALALGHPEYGYYRAQDPLGQRGDFTTAPEISQMFGEMLAAFYMDAWQQTGQPEQVKLIEAGPGRGTLMADMLRAIKANWPDFFATLDVHLVEINPVLKQQQQEMLTDYTVTWHDKLFDVPEGFTFFIGNEFLDALPIHQYERKQGQWFERCVTVDENNNLVFGLKETLFTDPAIKQDGIREVSPAVATAVGEISGRLIRYGGVAVLIDYGYTQENAMGDTFQAVSRHEFVSPLLHPGQVDLTAHVDFAAAAQAAEAAGAVVQGILTQRAFLCGLGIEQRATQLSAMGDEQQVKDIQAALHRLIAPDEMGDLFKVMVVTQ